MTTRRSFSSALVAGFTAVVAGTGSAKAGANAKPAAAFATSNARIRNVVLVHGLFADGSCWLDVILRLQAAGLRATAVQNGLLSLDADVAATRRVLDQQDGPTVLVGHSFGGMVVSEAGVHPKVASLVYVAARGPEAGEDYAALNARFPRPPAGDGVQVVDGFGRLSEAAFLADFAGDVTPTRARALYGVQQPFAVAMISERTTVAAWRTKPAWYQVSTKDRAIDPDQQRFVAARMKATTIEVDSSHVSMISHPDAIVKLILAAAS